MLLCFSHKSYIKKLYKSKIEEINDDASNKKYHEACEKCIFLINALKNSKKNNPDIMKNLLERIIFYHTKSGQDMSLLIPIYQDLLLLNTQRGFFNESAYVCEKLAMIASLDLSISYYRKAIEFYSFNLQYEYKIPECKIKLADILFKMRRFSEASTEYNINSNISNISNNINSNSDNIKMYCFFRECLCYISLKQFKIIDKKVKTYSGFIDPRYVLIHQISFSIHNKDISMFLKACSDYNCHYIFDDIEKEILKKLKYSVFKPKLEFY